MTYFLAGFFGVASGFDFGGLSLPGTLRMNKTLGKE
jgi:hypothetical protein